jgi:alpha-1,3-mannosyltransferase
MALPRAVLRGLLFVLALAGSYILFNVSRSTSASEGVWDASSWADRRTHTFGMGMEENPNLNPQFNSNSNSNSGSRWSIFGGNSGPQKPERPYRDTDFPSAPRPLSRPSLSSHSNTTYPRIAPGKSRIVIPGSIPEEYEEGPIPTLTEALAHLKPRLIDVKEKYGQIPREHMLWEPIFVPAVNEELQERYWHLRENWDADKKEWVMKSDRRWMLVTVCRQVAGE